MLIQNDISAIVDLQHVGSFLQEETTPDQNRGCTDGVVQITCGKFCSEQNSILLKKLNTLDFETLEVE